MTDTAIFERQRTAAALPPGAAMPQADDKDMLKAAAHLTRDLNQPVARIYWADLIASALTGYVALFAAMVAAGVGCARGWRGRSPRPLSRGQLHP